MSSSPAVGGFAALFASPTLVSLLRQFLTRPDTDFYQRELAGLTGSRLVQVQRDLLRLEGAGLVARRRHGNRVYYRACSDHPAFADLQAVFAKTVGVAEVLAALCWPYASRSTWPSSTALSPSATSRRAATSTCSSCPGTIRASS